MMSPEMSFKQLKEDFFHRIDFSPERKILDAGCMDALFYNFFLDFEKERSNKLFKSYVGIDLKEDSMATLAKEFEGSRADFQYGDLAGELPFTKKHFDMTFCTGTLHHIDFEYFVTVVEKLFWMTKKHLVFNFLHFEDDSNARELLVHTQVASRLDYFIHRKAEAEEVIHDLAKEFTQGSFQKKSYPISPMVSRMISGQYGKNLVETAYLFDLHPE